MFPFLLSDLNVNVLVDERVEILPTGFAADLPDFQQCSNDVGRVIPGTSATFSMGRIS